MKIIAKKHFRIKIGRSRREREKMKRGMKEKERKEKRKEEEEGGRKKERRKKEEGVHTRFFQILEYLPNQYA